MGLGRIGTAVALRAKAFNFRVVFYDPKHPNGHELGLGIERAATLEDLLRQTNTLSIHTPLTVETKGLLSHDQLSLLPQGAVVVNDARGPILDLDALYKLLKSGHIAGAGLDVLPVEPPVEPIPELLRAYRAREPWLEGRLVITPHSAWLTPHSWMDTRRKSAETMRAALLTNNPQNVITPDMYCITEPALECRREDRRCTGCTCCRGTRSRAGTRTSRTGSASSTRTAAGTRPARVGWGNPARRGRRARSGAVLDRAAHARDGVAGARRLLLAAAAHSSSKRDFYLAGAAALLDRLSRLDEAAGSRCW